MISPAITGVVSGGASGGIGGRRAGATGSVAVFLAKLTAGTATNIAFVGDSTSDGSANAGALYGRFNAVAKGARYGRWANATALDFGQNGATSAAWLGSVGAKSLASLITAAPDLVVFCLGINDRRTQARTVAQMDADCRSILTQIFAGVPNVCVVVFEPMAFLITGTGGFITTGTGQASTDEIRGVYRGLAGFHPRLVVCPGQDIMGGDVVWSVTNSPLGNKAVKYPATVLSGSGRTALASAFGWVSVDGIHPQSVQAYYARVDVLLALYGADQPLDVAAANSAQAGSYYSPHDTYARSLELTDYWQEIRTGFADNAVPVAQGYLDWKCQNDAGEADSAGRLQIAQGDVIIGETGTPQTITNLNISAQDAVTSRMWLTGYPPAALPAGRMKVYRHKYLRDATVEAYMKDTGLPWKRWGRVASGGANSFIIQSMTTAILTQYGWETNTSAWTIANGDIMVIVNGDGTNEVLTLSGVSFANNGNNRWLTNGTFSGNSASRAGKLFAVFGNHA